MLEVVGDTILIQSYYQWTTSEGELTWLSQGVFGVDRRTRANVSGYGNEVRSGQYFFPLHVEQTTYNLQNVFYNGPYTATFDRVETIDGLAVYVFRFSAININDNTGYDFLPIVPEAYNAITDGQGELWVEPTSGMVVDLEDSGTTHLADLTTSDPVADIYYWRDRYTPETRAAQLQRALQERLRIQVLESWLPAGLLVGGLGWLAVGLVSVLRRPARREP